jgi:hypothetical protein
MFNVSGTNRNLSPAGPTATSKIWLPANRLPTSHFTALLIDNPDGWSRAFSPVVPTLWLSSDSAAGKNAIAASVASQQVRRARTLNCLSVI